MKTVVYAQYGSPDVLQLKEMEKPTLNDNQVLVKVHAAGLNPIDWHRMRGHPLLRLMTGGLLKPKDTSLGTDVAGRVEAVGRNVAQFQPGDAVFGVCKGAFAEYARAAEHKLTLKPDNLSFEAAAAVPIAAFTALQALRDKGSIQPGQKVLISGASGGVGTFAVQIAKSLGAEVTAVCSTRHLDIMRAIGADHVIDYTCEDFTKTGQRYDLILAVNGYHPIFDYRRALSPQGIYIAAGGSLAQVLEGMLLGPLVSRIGRKRMGSMGITTTNQADLLVLRDLLAAGKIVPVIDRQYPLSKVADAIRYLAEGHAKGKVVITMEQPNNHKTSQLV